MTALVLTFPGPSYPAQVREGPPVLHRVAPGMWYLLVFGLACWKTVGFCWELVSSIISIWKSNCFTPVRKQEGFTCNDARPTLQDGLTCWSCLGGAVLTQCAFPIKSDSCWSGVLKAAFMQTHQSEGFTYKDIDNCFQHQSKLVKLYRQPRGATCFAPPAMPSLANTLCIWSPIGLALVRETHCVYIFKIITKTCYQYKK